MIRALRFRLILVALIASFACVGFAVGQQVSPVDDAAVSDLVGSSERIVAERMATTQ